MQNLNLRGCLALRLKQQNKPRLPRLIFVLSPLFFILFLNACSEHDHTTSSVTAPEFQPSEWFPGGSTSILTNTSIRFDLPANNLSIDEKVEFHVGKALAQQPWIKAPTITDSRDGLGPIYNARTCMACHVNGGKGTIPSTPNQELFGTLIRLSTTADQSKEHKNSLLKMGVVPHPTYGDQLQTQSTSLSHQLRHVPSAKSLEHDVTPEAYVHIEWKEKLVTYPDGQQVTLRKPSPKFQYLGYGEISPDTLIGLRTASSIHGMGLIELVPQTLINQLADEHDKNQDGISGKVNMVWNVETNTTQPGRFGLKSNKPTLAMTVAGAFANDLGISNPLFKSQPCSAMQKYCLDAPTGNDQNGHELTSQQLNSVINFNRNLAPLKARNLDKDNVRAGRNLFYQTGCHSCHNPSFKTGDSEQFPHLAKQTIWPYTDLLVHDMGIELSDNRPDFLASGQEWRTPPLWGIGIQSKVNGSTALLHDGRANTIEEAVLWHGGEAEQSKLSFMQLEKNQRDLLILFVNSI